MRDYDYDRVGCVACGYICDDPAETGDEDYPNTCPECDVLMVREGSPRWEHLIEGDQDA